MGALAPTMFAGAWKRDGGGMRKARRTCGQHSSTAVMRCHKKVYATAHADHTSYSQQQLYSNCSCQPGTKHVVFLGVGTANHGETALNCRVCGRKGSSWERVVYDLCDAEQLIELFAVEAHSLNKPEHAVEYEGVTLCTASKRWDVLLQCPWPLIEMQGQGHSSILFTKANNSNSSLAERRLKDRLYAEEALRQGWSVVWLWVDEDISTKSTLAALWAEQLHRAVAHVKSEGAPTLFVA